MIINSSIRLGAKLSLFGYYTLNYANSDTGTGASSFPSSFNNISLDYGRSAFDIRHRVFFGGTIGLPHAFRLSPFMTASSGGPYNITTGQDLNGDSIFNDRPAIATANSLPANVVTNRFGSFDVVPQPGETVVPINDLTGPSHFSMNLRLSKSFGFGQKGGSYRYDPGRSRWRAELLAAALVDRAGEAEAVVALAADEVAAGEPMPAAPITATI